MNYYVTRKAILIGCPGEDNNFLNGVKYDLDNVKNLLRSDKCGRWDDAEIITLQNPDRQTLLNVIQSTYADYLFIYFSGHGWTGNSDQRMLALRDYSISDLSLINKSPRQLIVADTCRKYIASGISGFPDFGERFDNFNGTYEARELFNYYIANSPHGKIIVYATQKNEFSYDSAKGGYFTQALAHIATRLTTEHNYTPVSITNILRHIPSYLQKQNNFQIPSIPFSTGNMTVPFAFGFRKVARQVRRTISQRQSTSNTNTLSAGEGWALFGLALVFCAAAASK